MKIREIRDLFLGGVIALLLIMGIAAALFGFQAGLFALLSGALLLAAFAFYTKNRLTEIAKLNDYLVRVLAGLEALQVTGQKEGELSILRTNIYKAATTLQHQNKVLADDKKQLADALADISHQLKTPLTSLMVMNDLLKDERDEAKREEFLMTQSVQLDRMNWLIQTLLKISKLDAGTIELAKEEAGLSQLVEESLKPFLIRMDLGSINCINNTTDLTIMCDKNWTVEAIQNIVKNCIEHMDKGGTLSFLSEDTNLYTALLIRDTGCGIAKEDLPHIFERFYKGKNAGSDSVGIGLALSQSIMQGQRGEILAESVEGEGTTFVLRFYKTLI